MLNKTLISGLVILGLAFTAGCSSNTSKSNNVAAKEVQTNAYADQSFEPVVLRVNGFGAQGKSDAMTNANQRNLMAMRASKLDAYRNLAERVYGTRIQGATTVQNLATRDDNIRGYVDNLVRGAKVLSTRDLGNGSYETYVELVLEPRFQQCMLRSESLVADPNCAQGALHGEHPSQRLSGSNSAEKNMQPRSRYHLD